MKKLHVFATFCTISAVSGITSLNASELLTLESYDGVKITETIKVDEISLKDTNSINKNAKVENPFAEMDALFTELIERETKALENIEALQTTIFANKEKLSNDTIKAWNNFVTESRKKEDEAVKLIEAEIEKIVPILVEFEAKVAELEKLLVNLTEELENVSTALEVAIDERNLISDEMKSLEAKLVVAQENQDEELIKELTLQIEEKQVELDYANDSVEKTQAVSDKLNAEYPDAVKNVNDQLETLVNELALEVEVNFETMYDVYAAYITYLETNHTELSAMVTKDIQPAVTPEKPVVTPEKPVVTPEKPVVTPEKPVVTPSKPTTSTQTPVVVTQKPVANTPQLANTALGSNGLLMVLALGAVSATYIAKNRKFK